MTIDISYFLYIFGENGSNMLYECLKQLVFKCYSLSNGKDSTQQYLTYWLNFALRRGTQTLIQNHRIVLLEKINVL